MRRTPVRFGLAGAAACAAVAGCNTLSLHERSAGPPATVTVSEDLQRVDLAWSAVAGASGYEVYVSTAAAWAQPITAADLGGLPPAASVGTTSTELPPTDPDAVLRYAIVALVGGKRTEPSRPVGAGLPRVAALGAPAAHLRGRDAGYELGASLAHADLDGDGRDDLIAGYPGPFIVGSDRFAISRNRLFGLSTDWQPIDASGFTGWALTVADVDGDGFPDVISGGPPTDNWSPGYATEASVVRGADDTLYDKVISSVAPSRPSTGWSVAGLPDVDADGKEEVAFSAPVLPLDEMVSGTGGGVGEVELLELGSAGLIQVRPAVHGVVGDRFGESIAAVPGLLGTGSACLAVGAPGAAGGGSVQTFRLDPAGLVTDVDVQPPPGAPSGFGRVVAAAGDVLGQGPGLLVAAQPTSGGGAIAFLYQSPSQSPVWTLGSFQVNGGLKLHPSRWLAGAGDVNCDGFDDVLVGEPAATGGAGRVSLYLGGSTSTPAAVWQAAGSPQERLGDQVMLYDFDGDGCSEVVVSAPDFATTPGVGASTRGEIYVWRGSPRQGLRLDAGAALRAGPDPNKSVLLSGPTFSDPLGSGPWTATLDWGEGDPPDVVQSDECTGPEDGTFFSCVGHPYITEGTYRIKVRVDAADGRFAEAVTTVEVLN